MLSIFHVFCDTRTSGAVLFAQIGNLSRDFDVPLAISKTSLCQLDNKLARLVISYCHHLDQGLDLHRHHG